MFAFLLAIIFLTFIDIIFRIIFYFIPNITKNSIYISGYESVFIVDYNLKNSNIPVIKRIHDNIIINSVVFMFFSVLFSTIIFFINIFRKIYEKIISSLMMFLFCVVLFSTIMFCINILFTVDDGLIFFSAIIIAAYITCSNKMIYFIAITFFAYLICYV